MNTPIRRFLVFALYTYEGKYYTREDVLESENFPSRKDLQEFAEFMEKDSWWSEFESITGITELSEEDYTSWISNS